MNPNICHDRKIVFVHNPKVAGTSLRDWLGFDEVPTRLAFIGAGLILVSVAFNAGLGVRNMRRAPGTW